MGVENKARRSRVGEMVVLMVACTGRTWGWQQPPGPGRFSQGMKVSREWRETKLGLSKTKLGLSKTAEPETKKEGNVLTNVLEARPVVTEFEDAAYFALSEETLTSWATFGAAVSVVLSALYVLWIRGDTGYCDDYLAGIMAKSGGDPHLATLALGTIFACTHSGLAALRPKMENLIGARAWRVIFACASLPLAYAWVLFWLVHRYDGVQLWHLPATEVSHYVLTSINFISFFFLYPSTFNLKEVAAVDKPKLHLWGTGVARITRHPQAFGQTLWSLAHGAYLGTSVTALTMFLLIAHHAFSIYHGDSRLAAKHGEAFQDLKATTSIVPFAAILDGRQQLPPDYYTEFLRGPYLVILIATTAAFLAHPQIQAFAAFNANTPLSPGGLLG